MSCRGLFALKLGAVSSLIIGVGFIAVAFSVPAKAMLAQILLERAWANVQAGNAAAKPWPWADITPVAEIEVPRLGRRAIVLEGASGEALAFGPGHMSNTPAIGAGGTAFVAGHRDTQFRFLGELEPGDLITATTPDGTRVLFHVAEARVVRADASGLDPMYEGPNGSRLALVTCYPFGGILRSPYRYVVLADRVANPAEKKI